MTTTVQPSDKYIQTEQSMKSLKEVLEDEDKFNLMIHSLYSSIPFDSELGKKSLMIMISDSIDIGN